LNAFILSTHHRNRHRKRRFGEDPPAAPAAADAAKAPADAAKDPSDLPTASASTTTTSKLSL